MHLNPHNSHLVVGLGWVAATNDVPVPALPDRPDPTVATKEVIERFMELAYRCGNLGVAFERCVDERHFQGHHAGKAHNARNTRKQLVAELQTARRIDVRRLLVDEDVGVAHLELFDLRGTSSQRIHMFRVRDGLIVEQWDSAC